MKIEEWSYKWGVKISVNKTKCFFFFYKEKDRLYFKT